MTSCYFQLVQPCNIHMQLQFGGFYKRGFLQRQQTIIRILLQVSALVFNGNATLLASAQTGDDAIIRVWKFSSKKCLAVFQSHINDPYCLRLAP